MEIIKSINIACAEIKLLDDGIIVLEYKPNYEVTLNDVKEVEEVLIALSNNDDIYCLMDNSGRFNHFTDEAQKFLSKEAQIVQENKIKCSAVVIDNLANRLIARFFTHFFKPNFSMKLFSNQKDAVDWLKSEKT